MPIARDRILVVESDPLAADLIGRQALQAAGFQVAIASDGPSAVQRAVQWNPDVILADLNLPGLSGKDLLVALSSQNLAAPVILLAQKGQEADIIQAFRLGAADYLLLPAREAEVVAAVERVLRQVHERRERERLASQLQQTNLELQSRVRELTSIFAVGKAVTSITDATMLMERILDAALRVTQADLGWFLLREENGKPFVLVAQKNLPPALDAQIGQPWDDGVSSLVALSGEPLTIHGDPLKRFKIAVLGQSALISPIKAQKLVIGLLVVMRRQAAAFLASEQHLIDALADYASISLVNAHQFRAAEDRARSLQTQADGAQIGERVNADLLRAVKKELTGPVETAAQALQKLGKDPTARWRPDQRQHLAAIQDQLDLLRNLAEGISTPQQAQTGNKAASANLNDVIRQTVRHAQPLAQMGGLALVTELPPEAVPVAVPPGLLGSIVDALASNAIKFSPPGGQVVLRLEKTPDRQAHLTVRNSGPALDAQTVAQIFSSTYRPEAVSVQRFGGPGIRLSLVKDLVVRSGGKIWLESQPGKGSVFHVALPLSR